MACYNPRFISRTRDGEATMFAHRADALLAPGQYQEVACRRCGACRRRHVRDWAIRGYHELQSHTRQINGVHVSKGCFLTLTYDDEHLPSDRSLDHEHWQLFCKHLRRRAGAGLKFLMCGEYGDERHTARPHYHAAIFGLDFSEDRYVLRRSGQKVEWISDWITRKWGRGFHTIAPLNFATICYVAGYVTKKLAKADWLADPENVTYGATADPIFVRRQEYIQMSRNPGLGNAWFHRWFREVYPRDTVRIGSKEYRPPRYYDKLLEKEDPELFQQVMAQRIEYVDKLGPTPDSQIEARKANFLAEQKLRPARKGH